MEAACQECQDDAVLVFFLPALLPTRERLQRRSGLMESFFSLFMISRIYQYIFVAFCVLIDEAAAFSSS